MDTLIQDLRYGVRALRRNPMYTLAAIVTLGLGIGANTAVFSVVNAVVLHSLPYPDPDQLVVVWGQRGAEHRLLESIPDIEDWRTRGHTFVDLGIVRSQSVNLTGVDAPDRLIGSFISANALTIVGARAERGRLFTTDETAQATGQKVAVLSHAAWTGRFGSDPGIIGKSIILNGAAHVVIGVLTPDYSDPFGPIDVWIPVTSLANANWTDRNNQNYWAVGRLRPGVTPEQAQRDLSSVSALMAKENPASNAGFDANIQSMRTMLTGGLSRILVTVFAFVAVVLLIACANVANLQLARATAREKELSLRAALGAGRMRIIRQLLTESLLLSVLGGAVGILLGVWATRAIVAALPGGLPAFAVVTLDQRVLWFSVLLTLGSGIVFGMAPAIYASRANLRAGAERRAASAETRGSHFHPRDLLVASQLAMCVVLLTGAGLLTRTLIALQQVELGFAPSQVITAEFRLPAVKYKNHEQIDQFMQRALASVRAVPGIRSAAFVGSVPLSGNFGRVTYQLEGQPPADVPPATLQNTVSSGYFNTMGMPLVAGRDFDDRDAFTAPPVAIVSQAFARHAWPGQDPLGRRIQILNGPTGNAPQMVTVIGVCGDLVQYTISDPIDGMIYQPREQAGGIFSSVVARTTGDPDAMGKQVRAAIWSVDKDQPVWKVRSLQFLVDRDLSGQRFLLMLTGVFAVLAVLLAAIGVYGVMSYVLARRTREIGIRLALGARRSALVGLVLGQGSRVIAAATVVGVLTAFGAARLMRSQLFGVSAADPVTFVLVPILLASIAMLATYIPARRAARVDPMVALRSE